MIAVPEVRRAAVAKLLAEAGADPYGKQNVRSMNCCGVPCPAWASRSRACLALITQNPDQALEVTSPIEQARKNGFEDTLYVLTTVAAVRAAAIEDSTATAVVA